MPKVRSSTRRDLAPLALDLRGSEVENCGLRLPPGLSETDWQAVGNSISRLRSRAAWWLGDWWAYGAAHYGERQAAINDTDWIGPDFQTCMNYASVCRRFPTSRRREVLSFAHHAEVSGLDKIAADRLLDWAEETLPTTGKPRSVRDLREERQRIDREDLNRRLAARTQGLPTVQFIAALPVAVRTARLEVPVVLSEVKERAFPVGVHVDPADMSPSQEGVPDSARVVPFPSSLAAGGEAADAQAVQMVLDAVRRAESLPISETMRECLTEVTKIVGASRYN